MGGIDWLLLIALAGSRSGRLMLQFFRHELVLSAYYTTTTMCRFKMYEVVLIRLVRLYIIIAYCFTPRLLKLHIT